jgi:hypothetical protein
VRAEFGIGILCQPPRLRRDADEETTLPSLPTTWSVTGVSTVTTTSDLPQFASGVGELGRNQRCGATVFCNRDYG